MQRTAKPLSLASIALVVTCFASALPTSARADGPREADRRVVVLKKLQEGGTGGEAPKVYFSGLSPAYLGVELVGLTPDLRIHFGVPDDRGVMIARIEEGSPAEAAGLAVGDVITELDGEAVETTWDLSLSVRQHEPGDEVDLEVWRDGQALQFAATIGKRERQQIDVGHLLLKGELGSDPDLYLQKRLEGEDPSTVIIRPQVIEELGENLRTIPWEEIGGKMRTRNQMLEERIQMLEKRLQELESRLDKEDRKK